MPEHLKNAADSPEFSRYLKSFLQRKEREYSHKVVSEALSTLTMVVSE